MRNRNAFSPRNQRWEAQIAIGRRLRDQFQVLTQAIPEPLVALLERLEGSGEGAPPQHMRVQVGPQTSDGESRLQQKGSSAESYAGDK